MMYEFQPQHRLSKGVGSCIRCVEYPLLALTSALPNGMLALWAWLGLAPIELELQFPHQ